MSYFPERILLSPVRSIMIAWRGMRMITFKRVSKWFGVLHVLRDVELEVRVGEVVVVCGPSGS